MIKTDTWLENRDIIKELQQTDAHFAEIFEAHCQLDKKINRLEQDLIKHSSRDEEIEQMKRQKLHLKDEIYQIIQKNKAQAAT